MIYEKKKISWRKPLVIIALAFSLAVAWIIAKPLVRKYWSMPDKQSSDGTAKDVSLEEKAKRENDAAEMDRLSGNLKEAAGSLPNADAENRMSAVEREMRDYYASQSK